MTRPLVVGLGRIGVSVTGIGAAMPELAPGGGTMDLAAVAFSVGQGVGVAVRAAAALGCAGRVAGMVSTDAMGKFARSQLAEAGIDVAELRPWGDVSPCRITALDRLGRRLLLDHGGLDPEEASRPALDPASTLGGAAALLCDGSWLEGQVAAGKLARARHVPVIVDLGEVVHGTAELIAVADVLIVSERACAELAPRSELHDALAELRELGPRAVVVTLGEAGAMGLHGDTLVECPAFPTELVDASGAGSVFHGGFAAGLLSDLPLARCIELGAAAAALSCQALGPWDGIPRREEVLELIRTRA